jgi:hypothetical protein
MARLGAPLLIHMARSSRPRLSRAIYHKAYAQSKLTPVRRYSGGFYSVPERYFWGRRGWRRRLFLNGQKAIFAGRRHQRWLL